MTADQISGKMKQAWVLARDNSVHEVAKALNKRIPFVPPTPETLLQAAIFSRHVMDYRPALVEIFLNLHHPAGEWEDYLERCRTWVTEMLEETTKYETELLRKPMQRLLDTLPERLKLVISIRYGFDNQGSKSLAKTGNAFNLTRERTRQLEAHALRMLRHPTRSRYLRHIVLGEHLRAGIFAEIENASNAPSIYLMWEEDFKRILSLKKTLVKDADKEQTEGAMSQSPPDPCDFLDRKNHTRPPDKKAHSNGEASHEVQLEIPFPN